MDINVDILLNETSNKPKTLCIYGSARFEQGGKIIQDTAISGMTEQIVRKPENGSCQAVSRLSVKDRPLYTISLCR